MTEDVQRAGYDPSEPRDPKGEWTSGGGGDAGRTEPGPAPKLPSAKDVPLYKNRRTNDTHKDRKIYDSRVDPSYFADHAKLKGENSLTTVLHERTGAKNKYYVRNWATHRDGEPTREIEVSQGGKVSVKDVDLDRHHRRDPHAEIVAIKGDGKPTGKHPGEGYSKHAVLRRDGSIYTTDVEDAARALHQGKKVELDQVKKVSTLIHKLGEEAQHFQQLGQKAPVFNLCDVTVTGTNLFCSETKGIPRVKMPQLDRVQTKAFLEYLKGKGYKVERERERADHLRATQDQLDGAKVAVNMDKLKDVEDHINKRLVVSKDDYILDGHHHWAAKIGLDAKDGKLSQATKMPVSRVNISITKLLEEAEKFTGGKGHKTVSESYGVTGPIGPGPCPTGEPGMQGGLVYKRYDPPPFPVVERAKRPKTEIELWPEKDQERDDFLDYCIGELTPCIGADRADEVCSAKWEASKQLGKKGFVSRADLDPDLAIEPCGKSCLACDAPPVTRFAEEFCNGVFVRAHVSHDTAEQIHDWAKTLTLPKGARLVDPNEYHTTLIVSRKPFDYSHDTYSSIYPTSDATNKRLEVLGKNDDDKVLTLRFDSHDLTIRYDSLKDQGAVSDFPEYKPHITIAKDVPADHDVSQHEVYSGPIEFTSESAEPVDLDKLKDWDESKHPREPSGTPEGGRFAGGGPAEGGGEKEPSAAKAPKLDPEIVNVGGDAFNQEIAKQLESEYQKARPKLDALAKGSEGEEAEAPEPEEDEEPEYYPPEDWDSLGTEAQQEAEDLWIEKNVDEWVDQESNNYYEEYAPAEARKIIADDFNNAKDRDKIEWVADAIEEARESETDDPADAEWRHDYPFTDKQILDAIHLDYTGEGGSYPMPDKPEFEWDDAYLDSLKETPTQIELPGIEPKHGSELLTEKMRGEIEAVLGKAFDKHGDSKAGDMEVPEWVTDSAKDSMAEFFGDLSDKEKWKFVTNNSEILDHEAEKYGGNKVTETVSGPIHLPNVYDPLNETTGSDYQRTQQLARYLSVERAMQIMKQRDLAYEPLKGEGEPEPISDDLLRSRIAKMDSELWRSWKDSSTSENGKLLQVATASELGGRVRMKHFGSTREEIVSRANRLYETIGGFEGIKAYVRAKWETTQYLLDKAGIKTLDLYRGYEEDRDKYDKMFSGKRRVIPYEEWERRHYAAHQSVRDPGYHADRDYMPTLDVERNGATSMTTDISVANGWRTGRKSKVTLRAQVPRTTVVSVPAYGINVHTEHEVVTAGAAFKGWDAWAGSAPSLSSVPMMKPEYFGPTSVAA